MLVGKCDRCLVPGFILLQSLSPLAFRVAAPMDVVQLAAGTMDEQRPQILVAALSDVSEPIAPARGILAGHQVRSRRQIDDHS